MIVLGEYIMKHYLFIVISLLSLGMVGCQTAPSTLLPDNRETPTTHPTKTLTYSNLVDEPTQAHINNLLLNAGIPSHTITTFTEQVNDFNKKVVYSSAFQEGYSAINQLEVDYSDLQLKDGLSTNENTPLDLNCRLTTFLLMKDLIHLGTLQTEANNYLMYDMLQFDENPDIQSLVPYKDEFITLFNPVDISPTASQEEQAQNVEKDLSQREIHFEHANKIAMINVYLHDPIENRRFVGHSGIMLFTDKGITFLEKIGAYQPYQVSQFASEEELITYLLNRSDFVGDGTEKPPLITKNNKVIYS